MSAIYCQSVSKLILLWKQLFTLVLANWNAIRSHGIALNAVVWVDLASLQTVKYIPLVWRLRRNNVFPTWIFHWCCNHEIIDSSRVRTTMIFLAFGFHCVCIAHHDLLQRCIYTIIVPINRLSRHQSVKPRWLSGLSLLWPTLSKELLTTIICYLTSFLALQCAVLLLLQLLDDVTLLKSVHLTQLHGHDLSIAHILEENLAIWYYNTVCNVNWIPVHSTVNIIRNVLYRWLMHLLLCMTLLFLTTFAYMNLIWHRTMVWQRRRILMQLCRIIVVYAWVSSEMLLWIPKRWFINRHLLLLIDKVLHRNILVMTLSSSIPDMFHRSSFNTIVSHILWIEFLIHIVSRGRKLWVILLVLRPIWNNSFLSIHVGQRWFVISFLLVEIFDWLDSLELHGLASFTCIFWASGYFRWISSYSTRMVIRRLKGIRLVKRLIYRLCKHRRLILLSVKPLLHYFAAVLRWWRCQGLMLSLLSIRRWRLI